MRAGILAVLMAGIALTQSSPQSQPPVFRSGTRLVQVNVVVHNKRGEPVADLKKEDFTILELGKPQQISFFSVDTAAPAPPAAISSAVAPAAPLASHTFTNVLPAHGGVPTSVTVILLDLLNAPPGAQMRAREGVIRFLKQIEPQDRIAIFAMTSRGLTLLHDYTTDSAALVERLRKTKPEISAPLDASTVDATADKELRDMGLDALADAEQKTADFFMADRISRSLSVFGAIAQHMAGIPGRKNLVWVSTAFPLSVDFDEVPSPGSVMSSRDHRTFTAEMGEAVRALNDSGIAVYPVDARGVFNPVIVESNIGARSPRDFGKMPSVANTSSPSATMFTLADRTGGRFAYNTNDLSGAIRRAMDDARVTYTLGYYPADTTLDGRFREIKVSVNRPGLDVRARKGYFAIRDVDRSADARLRDIQGAVWSPIESTALPVTVDVQLTGENAGTIEAMIEVDPQSVSFKKDGDRWKAELDVAYVQKDAHGVKRGAGGMDNLSIALTDENYKKVMEQGLNHRYRAAREPGATTLRIVVRDANTASIGSVTVPLDRIQPGGGRRP